jgi:hypothetical protein
MAPNFWFVHNIYLQNVNTACAGCGHNSAMTALQQTSSIQHCHSFLGHQRERCHHVFRQQRAPGVSAIKLFFFVTATLEN